MSVLVKGMEMPKICGQCQIKLGIDCELWKHVRSVSLDRHKDCPLTPIPPHGDLIDRNTLKNVQQADADLFKDSNDYGEKCRYDEAINAVANIINAPAIIPAEEE